MNDISFQARQDFEYLYIFELAKDIMLHVCVNPVSEHCKMSKFWKEPHLKEITVKNVSKIRYMQIVGSTEETQMLAGAYSLPRMSMSRIYHPIQQRKGC